MAAVALLASGCDWSQLGLWPSHSGLNVETTITTSNASTLTERFTTDGPSRIVESQPAVAGGVMYVLSDDGSLDAYSATGTTGCSGTPTVCSPLWTAQVDVSPGVSNPETPTVVNGIVYVLSYSSNQLDAYDAAGKTDCSGTPTVCTPLWRATVDAAQGESPTVANGIVYVVSQSGGDALAAFDANGVTNCSGIPKLCSPIWSSSALGSDALGRSVSVQDNVV